MKTKENNIAAILESSTIFLETELLVLKNGELFFISIERLLIAIDNLNEKQIKILSKRVHKLQDNKAQLLNFLHDLALRMLSVKL